VKRSTAVVLVLSGAILGGCSRRNEQTNAAAGPAARPSQVVTNDTYIAGRGYYHAPFHAWYPFPWNFYSPGRGYYRGGGYYTEPDLTIPKPTYPGRFAHASIQAEENVSRGGFARSGSSSSWHWGSSSS
jgi:hypothetical protein